MTKRLLLFIIGLVALGFGLFGQTPAVQAGCGGSFVNNLSGTIYRNYVFITYDNVGGITPITFNAFDTVGGGGNVGSITVNPAPTGTGLMVSFPIDQTQVAEGENVIVDPTPCGLSFTAAASGLYAPPGGGGGGGGGNTPQAAAPKPLCPDGRINFNHCDKIAIYPVSDEGSYGIEIWIVEPDGIGHFALFVPSVELDALAGEPDATVKIATSSNGLVTLYKLTNGNYLVSYGPDFEGKVFLFQFGGLPNGQYPNVTTYKVV